ncbi:hypothetical protein [Pollutimonas bauzanensis]|uniref:Uncharacterized protein n=1 Tax=Pollutimonas bauzanensis TaxID=658167 RepID=A0A1M5TI15_9BURK|nr:hypothetical protein [Pollutimonas bauzanensis]SHH50402.1 hypothetical protein SAMN04488135_103387 [Pollutimonas bauzanensis]
MSNLSYNQYSRLSDSLERDIMRDSWSNGEAVSIVTLGKQAFGGLKAGFKAFAGYMIDVTRALDEARAKDARYTRTAW